MSLPSPHHHIHDAPHAIPCQPLPSPPAQVGPRDVEQGTCVAARRDVPGKEGKQFGVPLEPAAFVVHIQVGAGAGVCVCVGERGGGGGGRATGNSSTGSEAPVAQPSQRSGLLLSIAIQCASASPPPPSRQLQGLLDDIQASLLAQARAFRDDNIVDVSSYDELKEAVAAGAQTAPPPPLLLPPSQAPALATLAIPLLLDPL